MERPAWTTANKLKLCLGVALLCLVGMTVAWTGSSVVPLQTDDVSNASLSGMDTLFVLVEDLPPGAKVLELTKSTIQSDIESKLRRAGIHVVTSDESRRLGIPGNPHLYVNISLTVDAQAASIRVELDQNALLQRNGQFARSVTTWDRHAGISNPSLHGIRDTIEREINTFVNAWLSVNPHHQV